MKFLVAIALLALAVAEAHHNPQHTLRGPRFKTGKLYKYDVMFNVTSGVLGLSTQVSKTALKAEVNIYAKSEKEYLLEIKNVSISGSLKAVDWDGYTPMENSHELEARLAEPIKFTLEDGEVTSYTLSPKDNLESKKIKKSILRSLEMHVPENALQKIENENDSELQIPVTYNVTKDTDFGVHTTHYMITSSPYAEFPAFTDVYNITRSDDFESEWYPAYHQHHNFHQQGCPQVCKKDWISNEYGAGCPFGYEPHHSPIKMAFNQQHHLSLYQGVMNPEIIRTVEAHVAQMYDQDMELLIEYELRRKTYSGKQSIVEPSGQQTYTDLKDMEPEINQKEIDELCYHQSADETEQKAQNLLTQIYKIIEAGNLEDKQTSLIGQKIILLRTALHKLAAPSLKKLASSMPLDDLNKAENQIKRQIWLDILPLIGSEESVTFITEYLKQNINNNHILVWEAKEILEALPQNIQRPSEKNIRELRSLTEIQKVKDSHLLHSAAHLALARVIGKMCGGYDDLSSPSEHKSSWFSYPQVMKSSEDDSSDHYGPLKCPEGLAKEIVQEISAKLERSDKKEDIAVYLETLAHIGLPEVLPVIAKYTYGAANNVQKFTPSYVDFVKTVSLFALHNVAGKHPEEVLQIVLPLFFNATENPKVRNAAFGVIIRCQPSLEILQHVAIKSWDEPSQEVGSYVTSTLETFGNSSLPCMQLTSHRIKKVLPQLRRFDIGLHHSKNLLWSYFDDQREFGLESRFEYTPSNESFIPSTLYKSLSYSSDSLRDVLMQMALNVQGLTQGKIIKKIEEFLHLKPMSSFDSTQEQQIFQDAELHARIPDALRLTFYKRIFYSSSYYYFEGQSAKDSFDSFREYLQKYLQVKRGEYDGYLVKLFMPSSYHAVAIARTLPYPVEFEISQPLVFALKIKSLKPVATRREFNFYIRPSVYYTKLFTNQLKNLRDCKEIGVYHEHKLAMSYPFELSYSAKQFPNVTFTYRIPELKKKVLRYFSEAGTYAGKKDLLILPSTSARVPIKTQPTLFKIENDLNIVGVPPFHFELHTEDIHLGTERVPQNPMEALDIVIRRALNAGWRHLCVNVTLQEDSKIWPRDTEVTFSFEYYREYITKFMNHPHSSPRYSSEQDSQSRNQWSSSSQRGSQSQEESQSEWSQDESQSQWSSQESQSKWSSQEPRSQWPSQDSQGPRFEWPRREPQSQWSSHESNSQSSSQESQWSSQESQFKSTSQESRMSHKDSPQWLSSSSQDDEDWARYLKPSDISRNKNPDTFIEQGRSAYYLLSSKPHIRHAWNVKITTRPLITTAFLKLEYNHTFSRSAHSLRAYASVKPSRGQHAYQVALDHFAAFFNKPNQFQYDTHKENQAGAFITAFELPRGSSSRPWENVEIISKGYLNYQSLEQLLNNELMHRVDPKYYFPETHEQCKQDIQSGQALSVDCIKAVQERSIYNKLQIAAIWNEKMPEFMKQIARRADLYTKHFLFQYLNMTDESQRHEPNILRLWFNHIDKFVDEPVFDVKIQTPKETFEYNRVPSLQSPPFSSIFSVLESRAMEATNNSYPPTCTWMKGYVQTYDQKAYQYHADECNYVLSSHCTKDKYFAITAQGLDKNKGTKKVTIYLSDKILVLTPKSENQWSLELNGQKQTIEEPKVIDRTEDIYVYADQTTEGSLLQVVALRAGVRVLYDGVNVKIQLDPRYKGELCGLCSEFDGEELREFRGLDRCLYTHPVDFARSAITNRQNQCNPKRLIGQKMCDDEQDTKAWRQDTRKDDGYVPTTRRNIVQSKGSEYCFSLLPVPVCEDNSTPSQSESHKVAFHCLPKRDVTAKKLLTESKRRVLGEIAYKSADFEETIQVAKMC